MSTNINLTLEACRSASGEEVAPPTSRPKTASTKLTPAVRQVGFWSALITGLLAFGWPLTMIIQTLLSPPNNWNGIAGFVQSFQPVQMLNFLPSLPLASAFLVLMVCIYFYGLEEKRVWGLLGVVFGTVYAVMASINYLIQLLTVRLSLSAGEIVGLGLFAHGNQHSIFWALATSYAYMSLALLFAAWVFGASRAERWVRGMFIAVGVTTPLQFAVVLLELGLPFGIATGLVWSVAVPAGCFILASVFWRS